MNLVLRITFAVSLLSVATPSGITIAAQSSPTHRSRTPVLAELFTSEGCSSCPPADKLLQMLDRDQPVQSADLIVLSEHVDYWNHGGWADPYSSPVFSSRQRSYADKLRLDEVYTPQLIVDGTAELVGSNAAKARSAIAKAAETEKPPIVLSHVVRDGNHLSVHLEAAASSTGRAVVFLALADSEDRSEVARGENSGRSLTHVAVVQTLTPVGTMAGASFSKDVTLKIKSPAQRELRVVAFMQEDASGKIVSVTQQKL